MLVTERLLLVSGSYDSYFDTVAVPASTCSVKSYGY